MNILNVSTMKTHPICLTVLLAADGASGSTLSLVNEPQHVDFVNLFQPLLLQPELDH
jgi:hypothetical protein